MSEPSLHGGCLCGAVSFEVGPPFHRMIHCHCSRCRKATGTGHATNLAAGAAGFRWLGGEEAIARYDLPTAQRFAKWFCRHCGCPVPRLAWGGKLVIVPAGSLDEPPPVSPTDHIFWGSRAPWACGSSGLPVHDTLPEGW